MRRWDAEVVVDENLARRLIGRFRELTLHSLRPLAEGWDNAVWLANEQWAFRFPRRALAVPGVEVEMATLPFLAPILPLPIPTPVFFGRPADAYPWPFFGSALLQGRETCDAALDDDARMAVALEIARFLRHLHAVDLPHELPIDPNGRAAMERRVPLTREQLADVEGLWRLPSSVERVLGEAERLPPAAPRALVHGDLHFRHLLVDDRLRLSGVIDWGDLCRADPAVDLQLVWSFVPPDGRAEFLRAYGAVSDDQLLRARVLAFSVCAALAAYGHEDGPATVEREALDGLERAATDG
jgi:aminoglycoside phosphotransferase (APT) family kinase protein